MSFLPQHLPVEIETGRTRATQNLSLPRPSFALSVQTAWTGPSRCRRWWFSQASPGRSVGFPKFHLQGIDYPAENETLQWEMTSIENLHMIRNMEVLVGTSSLNAGLSIAMITRGVIIGIIGLFRPSTLPLKPPSEAQLLVLRGPR